MILLKNILLNGAPVNIFIEGKRIFRILPAPNTGDIVPDETVDCTGKAVIPGFINMHTHAAMTLLRGITEDVPLHKWLSRIWDIEARIDENFIYWGTKVACLEMIKSGTTTFNDQYWYLSFPSSSWTISTRPRPSTSACGAWNCMSGPRSGAKPRTWRCRSIPSIPSARR